MKTVATILVMALFVIAGCQQPMAISVLGGMNTNSLDQVDEITQAESEGDSTELIARGGVIVGESKTEIGLSSHYWNTADADQQTFGIYVIQQLAEDGQPTSTFDAILGKPYIGAQASLGLDADGDMYGFMVGTVHKISGIEVLTEFQYRTYDDALKKLNGSDADKYKLFVGPRFKF